MHSTSSRGAFLRTGPLAVCGADFPSSTRTDVGTAPAPAVLPYLHRRLLLLCKTRAAWASFPAPTHARHTAYLASWCCRCIFDSPSLLKWLRRRSKKSFKQATPEEAAAAGEAAGDSRDARSADAGMGIGNAVSHTGLQIIGAYAFPCAVR